MRTRNIIFSLLVCILLASPSIIFCLQSINSSLLPGWVTSENAKYLIGGTKDAYVRGNISLNGFKSGRLQEAVQTEIGNHIPFKASVLLGNAALQRMFIEGSAGLFRYDYFTTYYGTDVVYIQSKDALSYIPSKEASSWPSRIGVFADQLADFAAAHPNIEFNIILPDMLFTSNVNPVKELVSQMTTTQNIVEAIEDRISSVRNATVSCKTYESYDEYLTDYYSTDGHWNGYGAIAAYNNFVAISNAGATYPSLPDTSLNESDLIYYGQNSRNGLMLLSERVNEPKLLTSSLSVEKGERGYLLADNGIELIKQAGLYGEYMFYGLWYGGNEPTTITSCENNSEDALIVSDSYGDPIRWIIANDYARTYGVMDLYGSSKEDITLNERLASTGATTVFFIGIPSDFASFLERHPRYFN